MALHSWKTPSFTGVQQGETLPLIASGNSPDACNMDTAGGMLRVAKGFVRHLPGAFPAPDTLLRLSALRQNGALTFLITASDGLYRYDSATDAFVRMQAFLTTNPAPGAFDYLEMPIGSEDDLLIADGQNRIVKWAGGDACAAFGSAEGLSDMPQKHLETYYGRLFAAGDPAHLSRLYWSQAPGDARTVENWAQDAASPNTGGGHVEVGTGADPITGLFALSNQLLIFKQDTLYRLLGDRPSNFRVAND